MLMQTEKAPQGAFFVTEILVKIKAGQILLLLFALYIIVP
jgi:hypothetical protein